MNTTGSFYKVLLLISSLQRQPIRPCWGQTF